MDSILLPTNELFWGTVSRWRQILLQQCNTHKLLTFHSQTHKIKARKTAKLVYSNNMTSVRNYIYIFMYFITFFLELVLPAMTWLRISSRRSQVNLNRWRFKRLNCSWVCGRSGFPSVVRLERLLGTEEYNLEPHIDDKLNWPFHANTGSCLRPNLAAQPPAGILPSLNIYHS